MNSVRRTIADIWSNLRTGSRVEQLPATAAADFGMTAADLVTAARMHGDVPTRMQQMATIFGADAALRTANRYRIFEMSLRCDRCQARRACTHALATTHGRRPEDVDFCPNADEYRVMSAANTGPECNSDTA